MFDKLVKKLQEDSADWEQVKELFQEKVIPAKTLLLKEGEISNCAYFIISGCLRMWFNNDGKDITFQFFFERQAVASFESFFGRKPSLFNLESLEQTKVLMLTKGGSDELIKLHPELMDGFQKLLIQRLGNYANLFLSRIKNKPQERYEELLQQHPEIIQRVPQHYIASYLGITPISLSRIRNRK